MSLLEKGRSRDSCVLFHGAILGATGYQKDERHPTIGHNVLIGANSTLLRPIKVGDTTKIGAISVIIKRNVPFTKKHCNQKLPISLNSPVAQLVRASDS